MDTVRVDVCYRPLRIGWAIREGDFDAFRQAIRLSYTLWGGRFNPIVVIDREAEAGKLIDLFRVDLIRPIGNSRAHEEFPKRFPHLINPFWNDDLFINGAPGEKDAQVLDIHNALVHLHDKPAWKLIREKDVRIHNWEPDDPLADVFLVQFGGYPDAGAIGIDYHSMLMQATEAREWCLSSSSPLIADTLDHSMIASLSAYGFMRHYSIPVRWENPGFFIGDVTNFDDLVCHWNLRAADIPLWFVDTNHLERYASILPAWEKRMRQMISHRQGSQQYVALWSRRENIDDAGKQLGDLRLIKRRIDKHTWDGHDVCPPMMYLGNMSTLGMIVRERGRPKIDFALSDKPFCADAWFRAQHLVASTSIIGGLYGHEEHTFNPPFVPEWNEFYARTMVFDHSRLRIESGRVGLVIDAAKTASFLYALPVAELVERVFRMAGFSAKVSSGGLITRQLITQLGGLQGAAVFKIAGVRQLLKQYGPTEAFTKKGAVDIIVSSAPAKPGAKFEDYQDSLGGLRASGRKLRPDIIFSHLVLLISDHDCTG